MFQVVFYQTASGNEVVRDFLRGLPVDDRKQAGEDLMVVQIGYPIGLPICRPLKNGLFEVRTSLPSRRELRMLFMFNRDHQCLVVLHAFIKTTRTTPRGELDLARKRMNEFKIEES